MKSKVGSVGQDLSQKAESSSGSPRARRIPKGIRHFFLWLFLGVSFLCLGFILISRAGGYKIDWRERKITQTGLIYIDSQPEDPQIYLNGKLNRLDRRQSLTMLIPGRYDLEIKKANYQIWNASVRVTAGRAVRLDAVQLFLEESQISEANEAEQKRFENLTPDEDIRVVNDSEIRIIDDGAEKLVTRFSYPIINVRWFPDKKHLAYVGNNEIRVVEMDGSNNMLLLQLKTEAENTDYYFQDNGKELVFRVGSKVKKARVQ